MNNNLLVFDTETTGLDTDKNELVEIAFQAVDFEGNPLGKLMNTFVYTDTKIPKEAAEIHKITNDMIAGAPLPAKVIKTMENHCIHYNCGALVAHNAPFDISTLSKYVGKDSPLRQLEIIDTLRLSRRLVHDSDNHKLATLVEHFDLQHNTDVIGEFHNAAVDVSYTVSLYKHLMAELFEINSFDDLIWYHDTPIKLAHMSFGKYRGKSFSEIPNSYKQWLSTIDLDIDLAHTLGVDQK